MRLGTILLALVVIAVIVAMCDSEARATSYTCDLVVPTITEQADETGVQTGHVSGDCSFAWHSRNEIWYRDRWHILGVNYHPGGAIGVRVVQPVDSETYAEQYGQWREIVRVLDSKGIVRVVVRGPISVVS